MGFLKSHWVKVVGLLAVGMAIEAATDAGYNSFQWAKAKLTGAK